MWISREFVAIVGVLSLAIAVPAVLPAAEVAPPGGDETENAEPPAGPPAATGLDTAEQGPAQPSASDEEKPKESIGTVVALTFEVEVTEDDETRTEIRIWGTGGEDESAAVDPASGKLTRVKIVTDADESVEGPPSPALHQKVRAGKLEPGDRVGFTGGGEAAIAVRRKIPGGGARALSAAGGLGAVLILAWAVLRGRANVKKLVIGEDKRYSSSKFQVALWFAVLIALYLSTVWLRSWASFGSLIAGIGIPTNLLLLSGMSVLSFAGAKGIKQSQVANAEARHVEATRQAAKMQARATHVSAQGGDVSDIRRAAVLGAQAVVVQGEADKAKAVVDKITAPGTPRFLHDLVQDNDGNPDLGSFQMLVVTLLAVATYLWIVLAWQGGAELVKATGVSLPDVDTTILATFGLGQGAYLTKKFAENPS